MKKIVKIFLILLMLISFATIVNATEASISLNSENKEIEQRSEIKVQLIINDFGRTGSMNALEGKMEYDAEKLNYKKVEYKNGWGGQITADGTGMALNKSGTIEKNEVIAEITYEVKETAELGKTKISLTNITTSTDGDEVEVNNTETEVEIVKKGSTETKNKVLSNIKITKAPSKIKYTEGEKVDTTGMEITAEYSDGTTKKVTDYTIDKTSALTVSDNEIIISYTEGEVTKTVSQSITVSKKSGTPEDNNDNKDEQKNDNKSNGNSQKDTNNNVSNGNSQKDGTTATGTYPKTGAEKIILPIIVLVVISTGTYFAYKKNKF